MYNLPYSSVASELWVYLVVGEYYQNWTSPDISTAAIAEQATKSFVEGTRLHSSLEAVKELGQSLCYLGRRVITKTEEPSPTGVTEPITPTLIAVIVVVVFLFLALCIMVGCICCYCYYARKDKKEEDK